MEPLLMTTVWSFGSRTRNLFVACSSRVGCSSRKASASSWEAGGTFFKDAIMSAHVCLPPLPDLVLPLLIPFIAAAIMLIIISTPPLPPPPPYGLLPQESSPPQLPLPQDML